MFISESASYKIAYEYSEFMLFLVQCRWYFAGHFGKTKEDYVRVFQSVKTCCSGPGWVLPKYNSSLSKLIDAIEIILKSKKLTPGQIDQIAELLRSYLDEDERKFREHFLKSRFRQVVAETYSYPLVSEVRALLDAGKYDAAIVAAFKYLDSQMQSALKVPSTQYYGEDLINLAFSPNSGRLQLNTHQNEQQGLRNFFSGANSVFRNPSAHRFMKYDSFSANTIVAMAAMMASIVKKLSDRQKRRAKAAAKNQGTNSSS